MAPILRALMMGVISMMAVVPLLPAQDNPQEATVVTAGFHIRGPRHPAGGTRAWCIGEEGLLNPYNNRTALAEGYDLTVKGEEAWLIENKFEKFSTPLWTLGEGMSQRSSEAPVLVAEIEDLAVDLFDARGEVGMVLLCANGFDIGLLNRQNFRHVHVLGDPVVKSLQGKANIAYGHLRGNAGGHIVVTCRSFKLIVTVEDNPGFTDATSAGGIPPRNDTLYLDGQSADVIITIEPDYYRYLLDSVEWNHVTTDPETPLNNPDGAAIKIISDENDLLKATVPNVRWVGIQSGVDSRFGATEYCNSDILWVIDGTFTLNDGYEIFEMRACEPGELTATVGHIAARNATDAITGMTRTYINGMAHQAIYFDGPIEEGAEFPLYMGEYDLIEDPDHAGGWLPQVRRGGMHLVVSTNGTTEVWCLPESQFFDLFVAHEDRHIQQAADRLGPFSEDLEDDRINAMLAAWAEGVEKLLQDQADNALYLRPLNQDQVSVLARQAYAEAQDQVLYDPFRKTPHPEKCWIERDADKHAEQVSGKSWFWSLECGGRYAACKGVSDPDGCGVPGGQSPPENNN